MTELEMLRRICTAYEDELRKRMLPEDFDEFTSRIARVIFAEDIINMEDSDFKECCLNNFKKLTGTEDDFRKLLSEFDDNELSIEPNEGNED